jgi:hypothetical protein
LLEEPQVQGMLMNALLLKAPIVAPAAWASQWQRKILKLVLYSGISDTGVVVQLRFWIWGRGMS